MPPKNSMFSSVGFTVRVMLYQHCGEAELNALSNAHGPRVPVPLSVGARLICVHVGLASHALAVVHKPNMPPVFALLTAT